MRTTVMDILRFAWAVFRSPARKHLRIGQMVGNVNTSYYLENAALTRAMKVPR